MKINEILTEETTWADITQKYGSNPDLLKMIQRAGQDPRNIQNGKVDWGSAIDLGSAEYQKDILKQQQAKSQADDNDFTLGSRFGFQSAQSAEVDDIPSSALDPIIPSSEGGGQYSQGYNLDTHGHLSNRNAADAVGKWAKDSFGDLPGAKTIGKVAKKVGQTRVAKAAKKSIDSMKGGYDFMSKANPDAWEKFKNSGYKR